VNALERVDSGVGERGVMAGDSAVVVVVGGVTDCGGVVPLVVKNCWSDMFVAIAFRGYKGIGVCLACALCCVG